MLERSITEAYDRILLANGAFGFVTSSLGGRKPMQHRQPHDRLRLELKPFEEVAQCDLIAGFGAFKATAHRGLYIGTTERCYFA